MGEIFKRVDNLVKKKYIFFTTPGHKQGSAYRREKNFSKNLLKYDLTEVYGLDNLHSPKSCIKESLEKLSEFYESKKSYYLVNGSTSGIHIMTFACFKEGDEVLVERACHKSILNSLALRKVKINYIDTQKYIIDFLMPKNIGYRYEYDKDMILKYIKKLILKYPNTKGVILTIPNYYGFYINHEKIYEYLKSIKVLFLLDSAHGAHIRSFSKDIPCPNTYCDISVMSAHKTLPALTQAAYLHVNNEKLIENCDKFFDIFTTTSPSYLFMISLEKSLEDSKNYYTKHGDFILNINKIKKKLCRNNLISTIFNSEIKKVSNNNFYFDDTRICIKFNYEGFSSNNLYKYLFSKKIVCEMSFFNGIVLIPTIYNSKQHFNKLAKYVKMFYDEGVECTMIDTINKFLSIYYDKVLDIYETLDLEYEVLSLTDCIGRISLENIFLYPPGTPLIIKGEKIKREHVNLIEHYISKSYEVFGISDNWYVKVVKE